MAVQRHKVDCMPAEVLEAYKAQRRLDEVMYVPNLLRDQWHTLEVLLDRLLEPLMRPNASTANVDTKAVVGVLRLQGRFLEMMLKVLGVLGEAPQPETEKTNVVTAGAWNQMVQDLQEDAGADDHKRMLLGLLLIEEE
jgi:hypothetical protein